MSGKTKQTKKRSKKASQNNRSKLQIAQSRKNGEQSKGPKTQAGKEKSRRNALKHGLTAKSLKPPKDIRGQHELFEHFHEELVNEYRPNGFTAETIVSNLAHDYVQLIRCRRMMEALQRPKSLPQNEKKQWEELERKKKYREHLATAIACITANEDLDFPLEVARQLASKVANLVNQTREDFDEVQEAGKAGPAKTDDLVPFQDCEVQEIKDLWGIMRPCHRKLADEDHLTRVFNGQILISRTQSHRLRELLKHLEKNASFGVSTYRGVQNKADAMIENMLYAIAQDPSEIMRLERYLRDIERSIDRKLKELQDRET